ncbi:hypothetical protein JVT61DRAFT_42 [Boletus reticuloceps]|uniref:DUF6532 domain-containing protein n=1 Tax=Boletus reticuloceps TaxID=495285 RepID=A0A8I2YY34_9AGAM|nr:hypothetical protein JVT61DRAFT_42 [Boletus reticuloceps]
MAARALATLINIFLYSGPTALGAIFPKVFSCEVPQVAVCLAAILRAAIDEYVMTGTHQDQTFEYVGYSKIYTNFHMMQLTINKDLKHAAKPKALKVEWAASAW